MNKPSKMSAHGLAVLKFYESLYLRSYPDPASSLGKALQSRGIWQSVLRGATIPADLVNLNGAPWTVGYGITGPNVVPGITITAEEADRLLAQRLAQEFEPAVSAMVTTGLTQGQFDGLVDLAYNIGVGALRSSTLVRILNQDDYTGAADQFLRWDKAGGQSMKGLRRRRASDRALFQGKSANESIAIGQLVE